MYYTQVENAMLRRDMHEKCADMRGGKYIQISKK